jgi:hypothetical protein
MEVDMPTREVTLLELWQACRMSEDSCRRIADVLGEIMRQADSADPPQRMTVTVTLPDAWPIPEPDPPCIPPFCQISFTALLEKVMRLASRVGVLTVAFTTLRDRNPGGVIRFYTDVPGGPPQS